MRQDANNKRSNSCQDRKTISAESIERLAGRRVVAGMSGGKDSTAMALWLREHGIEFEGVFCDTGWEADVTYEYVRETLEPMFGPIRWLQSDKGGLADIAKSKGMFPSRMRRWCTQELKVYPIRDYLRGLDFEPVSAVGIRAGESKARSRMGEWEFNDTYDADVWRPLIAWTEQDVIDIHTRHGIAPNPLYLRGAQRVGCWPCIMSRKKEIAHIADHDPARIDTIRALEADVTARAYERKDAKGEPRPKNAPTLFQAKTGRTGDCWPIDKVVDWSRTARGGRQYEMFAPDHESGCVRWGLCESLQVENDDD